MNRIGSMRDTKLSDDPSMKVNVPALAPTTPPDIGASTNIPCCVECTAFATSLEETGSMVEQSMKRRSGFATTASDKGGWRIWPNTFLTCSGLGNAVIVVC